MFTRLFHYYWNLAVRQKQWLRLVTSLFCISIISGAVSYGIIPDLQNQLADMFKEIVGDTFTFDFAMVLKIFVNNITSALLMMFGGFIFGLIPLFAISLNGFIIGYVIMGSFFSFPTNIFQTAYFSFATIIPHGVFEIPAILFSAALGIRFGTEWMHNSSAQSRSNIFKKTFIWALATIPILAVILFIAANIEVFVSSRIGYALVSGGGFYIQH